MKVKYFALGLALSLVLTVNASAQLVAGTPQDEFFGRIVDATDPNERLELAMEFEQEFPDSVVMGQIYTMIMTVYNQQQNSPSAIEYGEKAVALDESNVEALIALTYNLALTRGNLTLAIEYGQRALAAIEAMRTVEPRAGYTPESWNEYADNLQASAEGYLTYAETIR
jgi:tetratricopeptide (TPR) repeat protein